MVTLGTVLRASIGMGIVSLLASLVAALALQDLYHGETDLTLEWRVLRVSFLVIIAFHVVALMALWKTLREHP